MRAVLAMVGLSMLVVGLDGCGASITQQTPASSTPLPAATSATRGSPGPTSWTMPNLVNSTLQSAQDRIQSLTNYGIAITTSHDATATGRHQILDRDWKVCSQNVPPGATIDSGTRIDFGVVKLEEACP